MRFTCIAFRVTALAENRAASSYRAVTRWTQWGRAANPGPIPFAVSGSVPGT